MDWLFGQACALLANVATLFVGIMLIVTNYIDEAAIQAGEAVDSTQRNAISFVMFVANLLVLGLPPLQALANSPLSAKAAALLKRWCSDSEDVYNQDGLGKMPGPDGKELGPDSEEENVADVEKGCVEPTAINPVQAVLAGAREDFPSPAAAGLAGWISCGKDNLMEPTDAPALWQQSPSAELCVDGNQHHFAGAAAAANRRLYSTGIDSSNFASVSC